MKTGVAPGGVRYAVQRGGNNVAWCALTVGCGTRDEGSYPGGIAHFTEHTVFRGTAKRSADSISSCLDRLGGELNAYTTKEETVFHATVLKQDLWTAAKLLLELALEPVFPDDEVLTEKGVVLDEIISSKDSPADDIYDNFEKLLYEGSQLETPILGSTSSVKRITPAMLRRFVKEKYIPQAMVLTIVANEDESVLEKRLLRLLGARFSFTAAPVLREHSTPVEANVFSRRVDKRNHEVNAVIGAQAPSLYEPKRRIVAAFLANILGGPASNSLLNARLREKKGWVYGIECSYTQYADTGVMAISFGCDRQNLEACLGEIEKILDGLRSRELSPSRLKGFRRQMLGQLAISSESGEARCLSMGKSLISWNAIMGSEEIREAISNITPEDIRALAAEVLSSSRLSTLIYL